jgi:tetratricopeptide (TPR) repeat protein
MNVMLTEQAREALRLAEDDPRRSSALADAIARQARAKRDLSAAAVAERALGLAAFHVDDTDTAMQHLREAMVLGRRAAAPVLVAEARMTLAWVLTARGRPQRGLREIDLAVAGLAGVERARARAQRGVILYQLGRPDDALAGYRSALRTLRQAGDDLWVFSVLFNRSVLHGYRREFAAAERDLHEAEKLCQKLKLDLTAGFVRQNLGWISALRGDVPMALHHLDVAEQRLRDLHARVGEVLVDRSETLLSVCLVSEAREAAERAVAAFERERQQIALPEARLLLARAATLDGDPADALVQARRAVGEFTRLQRPQWAVLARFEVLAARLAGAEGPQVTPGQLERVASALAEAGWASAALLAGLLAGRLALDRNRGGEGRRLLARVSAARRRGPATARSMGWHAEALLRLQDGNRRGAASAARAGLRVLDDHRATLGATDLRASASGHRTELARLGLRIALQDGNAAQALAWAEQGRASHLLLRPVRSPDEPELAQALAELRATMAVIDEVQSARQRTSLVVRQTALERRIRDYCRRRPGESLAAQGEPPPVRSLVEALGNAALVEFIELDGMLQVVTVIDGRARLHQFGPLQEPLDALEFVPFGLHRLARKRANPASRAAAVTMLRRAAQRLDAALLQPLAGQLAARPLVLVLTGPLQSVPWSVLPSCVGRPVTVSPSAALWYEAIRRPARPGPVIVAAGPGLVGARAEAEAVAAIHRTSALAGAAATVDAVAAGLNSASLVHLAAHGRVSADNPLFSSVRLADGPLTVYDLERLDRVPSAVILAACETGRPVVYAGDELLGLAATFLAQGAQHVIASVVPTPDAETVPLMTAFHRLLVAGHPVADALGRAQQQVARGETTAMAAAAGFICIGAGLTALTAVPASGKPPAAPASFTGRSRGPVQSGSR